jgi:hypothetical protein
MDQWNGQMDLSNQVIKLCMAGIRAEYEGRLEEAHKIYQQAWQAAQDDYEACIAAHYVARFQENPQETLRWNLEALSRAAKVQQERIQDFYPSLYLNLGKSYEMTGSQAEAQHYYDLAAGLGYPHQPD